MLRVVVGGTALIISSGAALLLLLTVVPYYSLWAVALGAGEWSLWIGLLGAVGATLGLLAARFGGIAGLIGGIAVAVGVAAMLLALLPPLQALPVARAEGVQLSLGRYLFGFVQPPAASTVQSVTFSTQGGQALQLDVWQPVEAASGLRPAVVVIHGGSWSSGGRSDFPRWNSWLNQNGYVVFDVDYRLAPQPNWQTATGDVKCAVGYVAEHAGEYRVDPQRIALLGRSAGGHLALLAAYTPGVAELQPSCDVPEVPIRAVVDFYGPTDLVWGYNASLAGEGVGARTLERFLGGTPSSLPAVYRAAAPISYAGVAPPPSLLLHGRRDQVVGVPHTERLAAALSAANIAHEAVYIPYAQHGFDYNYNGWGSQIAQPVILRFLETHLAAEQSAKP